jgi:hypothetical protein
MGIEAILHGAARGPDDPDIELARLLMELDLSGDQTALVKALERLARDAHQD